MRQLRTRIRRKRMDYQTVNCWTCGEPSKQSCNCGATICPRHAHVWLDDVADQINKHRITRCLGCHIAAPEAWRSWCPRPYTLGRAIGRGEWEAYDDE